MASPAPMPGKCAGHWNTVKHQKLQSLPNNITQKYQMCSVHAVCTPVEWPKKLTKVRHLHQ